MEEIKDKQVVVNIENYTGEKPVEVIIRQGEAEVLPEPLPNQEPLKVRIKGTLETPANWLEKRVEEHDTKKMYAVIDRDALQIGLVVNEDDQRNKIIVNGVLEFSETYLGFRINDKTGWLPSELGQFIRMNRSLFSDQKVAIELVAKLKKFQANVKSKLEKSEDRNGSRGIIYEQAVTSNLPTEFSISIPIFKGGKKETIEVEVDHYINGVDCFLQLFSPGAQDIVNGISNDIMDAEVNRLKSACPDIVIVEGPLKDNNASV